MTATVGPQPTSRAIAPIPLRRRLYGLGSVYGKTLRDSRLAFIIMAGLLGGITFYLCVAISGLFATTEARMELAQLATNLPPIMQGMGGRPVAVETLGGYMMFKYGFFFPILTGMWSILALSGTLATEARRGSLDLVAAAPFGKRRVALEKLAAHLTAMAGVVLILALATWLGTTLFGRLPGDAVSFADSVAFALYVGLLGLASGSVAFALAPFLGRMAAAGIAMLVMFAGWILAGYSVPYPALEAPAYLTWFGWTVNHLPLQARSDWPSLILVAVVAAALLASGVVAFARRDLGITATLPTWGLPRSLRGLRGPAGRSFAELLPAGLSWGIGLGTYGLVIAASSTAFTADVVADSPDLVRFIRDAFPLYDPVSVGGWLQLLFVQFGFIVIGFAAATLVAGWASDETSGRLEMLLTTPMARLRWVIQSGVGALAAIAAMTVLLAVGIGLGALMSGSDALTPMAGAVVLGLYAAALAGIGFAVGGLLRMALAAEVVAAIVVVTFLLDIVAPAARLPDWVHQLALTALLVYPMVGVWDWGGMALMVGLAGGGLLLGAWGFARRDLPG
jgi:ABC-2 type transport system permease protein